MRQNTVAVLFLLFAALSTTRVFAQREQTEVRLVHPQGGTASLFEVATIKPDADETLGLRAQLLPSRFSLTHASIFDLIRFAYGVRMDDQIVGLSSWMRTEHFNIQAKASDQDITAYDKLDLDGRLMMPRLLLQSLLRDRFQLKTRVETRDLPAYALVVAKTGIRMRQVPVDTLTPMGVHGPPNAHLPALKMTGSNKITATAWPMSQMAEWLSHFYEVQDRPVVDETGLKGNYDFVLSGVAMIQPPASNAGSSGTQEPITSIFEALPEQLGLKLKPRKAPVEVLVIEHVERPSPN